MGSVCDPLRQVPIQIEHSFGGAAPWMGTRASQGDLRSLGVSLGEHGCVAVAGLEATPVAVAAPHITSAGSLPLIGAAQPLALLCAQLLCFLPGDAL